MTIHLYSNAMESDEKPTLSDVLPDVWLGYPTILDAFHHLMDQHYDGEGRNPWVVAELKSGYFQVMTDREAEDCDDVREWYTLRFNPDYSVTLEGWSDGEDFMTIQEGK